MTTITPSQHRLNPHIFRNLPQPCFHRRDNACTVPGDRHHQCCHRGHRHLLEPKAAIPHPSRSFRVDRFDWSAAQAPVRVHPRTAGEQPSPLRETMTGERSPREKLPRHGHGPSTLRVVNTSHGLCATAALSRAAPDGGLQTHLHP